MTSAADNPSANQGQWPRRALRAAASKSVPSRTLEVLTLSDSLAARLAARINEGELLPGQRLTSERLLAVEGGVSRPALREALQALQAVGLVQSRQKSGWYVTEHGSDAGAPALARWMQLQPVSEVVMVRRVLEPDAVRAVPAVKVEALAKECSQILAAMRKAVKDGDAPRAAQLHSDFHLTLIQYTPSRLARVLITSMVDATRNAQRHIFVTPAANVESIARHASILTPLKAGNVEEAARQVAEHLQPVFAYRTGAAAFPPTTSKTGLGKTNNRGTSG